MKEVEVWYCNFGGHKHSSHEAADDCKDCIREEKEREAKLTCLDEVYETRYDCNPMPERVRLAV